MPPYLLKIESGRLTAYLDKKLTPSAYMPKIGRMVKTGAEMVRQQAVTNVGGYPVVYNGRSFRVMVRTGALRGSMEVAYPFGDSYTARIFVNGTHMASGAGAGEVVPGHFRPRPVSDYANAIEQGHGPIDLKRTMQGKVVPFFASRGEKSRGPFAARGLVPLDGGTGYVNLKLNKRLALRGKNPLVFQKRGGKAAYEGGKKGGTSYYIAFRRVGRTGWVIPRAEPRPFMGAALARQTPKIRAMFRKGVNEMFSPEGG